jgi:hypothetical protein
VNKRHEYKGKIIENIPLNNEPRWFIFEANGDRSTFIDSNVKISPVKRLKDAKETVDKIFV